MKNPALALAVILAGCAPFAQAHPIYALFPQDVRFHLSFDDETCNAEMAAGKGEPVRVAGTPVFCRGLFGQALETGGVTFDAAKNIDLTAPGTVIFWVAPVNWPAIKPENGKEPGFSAFSAWGEAKDYGYDLFIGKMSGQSWGAGHLNTYVQYRTPAIKHVNCIVYNAGRASEWENGAWRMLAVTWGGGQFTYSVNGKKSTVSGLKSLMSGVTKTFRIGTAEDSKNYNVKVDELLILNRMLSDDELKTLYDRTREAVAAQTNEIN